MRTWENITKVQRIFLLLVLTFVVASAILTWYGVTFLGLKEANARVASLIQSYGAPLGLFLNSVTSIAAIFFLWFLWILFPLTLKRRRKWQLGIRALNLTGIFLFTFIFFVQAFWLWLFDVANDAAWVLFRSNVFFSLLQGTDFAIFVTTIFALISTVIYLALSRDFKKLARRKRKRGS